MDTIPTHSQAKVLMRETKNQRMYQKTIKKLKDYEYIPDAKIPLTTKYRNQSTPMDFETSVGDDKISNELIDFIKER